MNVRCMLGRQADRLEFEILCPKEHCQFPPFNEGCRFRVSPVSGNMSPATWFSLWLPLSVLLQVYMDVGVVAHATGSAYVEFNHTKVRH